MKGAYQTCADPEILRPHQSADDHRSATASAGRSVLFCSLAVLDPKVGHTIDVLSPFIPVLCHSD